MSQRNINLLRTFTINFKFITNIKTCKIKLVLRNLTQQLSTSYLFEWTNVRSLFI